MNVELDLPYPPSVNRYYRFHRGKQRVLISAKGREYREKVCTIVAEMGLGAMAGPLVVEIEIYPPDNKKRDLDNVAGKALLDSLQHAGLYHDDNQIVKIIAERKSVVKGGAAIVRLRKAKAA